MWLTAIALVCLALLAGGLILVNWVNKEEKGDEEARRRDDRGGS